MSAEYRPENSGSEMTGLIIILIGFGLLMNAMGLFPFVPILGRFWLPMLLIAIGLIHLSKSRGADGWMAGVFWIGIGVLFLFSKLNFFQFNIWQLLGPLIVIWIGASILMKGMTRQALIRGKSVDSSDTISATAILGGFDRKCTSQQFQGGDLTTVMGGGELNLRDADMNIEGAALEVFTIMGGIEVYVPDTWIVESHVTPILGSYEDRTHSPREGGKRLLIRGTIIMGGITVKN